MTLRPAGIVLIAVSAMLMPACSFAGGPLAFSPVRSVPQNQAPSPREQSAPTAPAGEPAMPIDPTVAMLHSLALPGWGQFDNGSTWKAALLITAELICIGGVIYESNRLSDNNLTEFDREVIRTDRNTFIIYWMLAKFAGMMDAYVDAQLANFDVTDLTPPGLERSEDAP